MPPEVKAILCSQLAAPVDLYGLLELYILHELAHTFGGGSTLDIPSPVNGLRSSGFYYVRNVGIEVWDNAELVAFMGLLSKLVQLGFEVDANGHLNRIELSAKRSLVNTSRYFIDG